MKYILLPIFFFASSLCANQVDLGPLWQDKNFGFERTLCIESSLDNIDDLTRYSPPSIREKVGRELLLIRFNLGCPITEQEFDSLVKD